MSQHNSTSAPTASVTAERIFLVLEDWKTGNGDVESTNQTLDFLEHVIDSLADIDERVHAHFADNTKGEELLKKYGPDITFADLDHEAARSIRTTATPQ